MIVIIAVSYFGSNDIPNYLASLKAQTLSRWQLVVVDNSESPEELAHLVNAVKEEPRAQILRAPRNLGYFGAADWAMKQVDTTGAEWLVVSNTDLRIASSDSLENLQTVNVERIGVVAPSVVSDRDSRDQNPFLRTRPSVSMLNRRRIILGNPFTAQAAIIYSALRSRFRRPTASEGTPQQGIYAAHGSFIALSRAYFEAGGHLSHPVFLFAEEIFVAEQCRQLGLATVYVPTVRIQHVEHGQMGYFRSRRMLKHTAKASAFAHDLVRSRATSDEP